ncbi:MAG: DUF4399 domain-containing protein [Rhodanobacter sp.]
MVAQNTGRHHLLVGVKQLPAADQPIPGDTRHIRLRSGQIATTPKFEPGPGAGFRRCP